MHKIPVLRKVNYSLRTSRKVSKWNFPPQSPLVHRIIDSRIHTMDLVCHWSNVDLIVVLETYWRRSVSVKMIFRINFIKVKSIIYFSFDYSWRPPPVAGARCRGGYCAGAEAALLNGDCRLGARHRTRTLVARLAIADTIVPQLDNTLHPAPPRDKDTAGHCPFVKPNFLFLSLENILTQQGLKQITDFLE